jgi:vancomycin resistance protein YoaR
MRRTSLVAYCIVAALVGYAAAIAISAIPHGRDSVPGGTVVGGVPVGGLGREEAVRLVAARARPEGGELRILVPGGERSVPLEELDPRPRAREAVDRAIAADSYTDRVLRGLRLGGTRTVPVRFRLTGDRGRRLADEIGEAVDRPARSARISVSPTEVTVEPARPGRALDRALFARRVSALPETLGAPVTVVAPEVTTGAALAARERVRALRKPVRVRFDGVTRVLTAAEVRALATARVEGRRIVVGLDETRLAERLRRDFPDAVVEPRAATFRVSGDRVSVVPGRIGRTVEPGATARAVANAPAGAAVALRVTTRAPSLTTAQARALRIRERVAEFTTPYTCCPPRVTNIRRAAEILDGTVIRPDETFSLNTALGERTTERGFVPAPQINAGRLEDAVGGGVSQIATTVFNAAFFAGLRIDSFTPHEFWISRYPPGREATVSWGGPEMIVTNDWPAGVLMRVEATDTGVTVRLYSSRLGRRVETTTETPEGTSGAFPVRFTRRVYEGDRVRRDETFRWSYRTAPEE